MGGVSVPVLKELPSMVLHQTMVSAKQNEEAGIAQWQSTFWTKYEALRLQPQHSSSSQN